MYGGLADNPNADRVKRYRSLGQAAARRRTGLFLVEGPQSVRELVRFNPDAIETLYLTEAAQQRYTEIIEAAATNSVTITLATEQVIQTISDNAQQVLAVAKADKFQFSQSAELTLPKKARLIAILHNVRDPGNAGTVIRAADALGADLTVLTGDSVEITNPKVIRSSAGSVFHVPVIAERDLGGIVNSLKAKNWQVLAATASQDKNILDPKLDLTRPTAWIFGNEAWGLPRDAIALADEAVSIPIYGSAESLNLATAASICLFATAAAQH